MRGGILKSLKYVWKGPKEILKILTEVWRCLDDF